MAACEEARAILLDAGARNLTDLRAASIYADTTDSQARHSAADGQSRRTPQRLEAEVYEMPRKCWRKRPGDLRSMANRALAADLLGRLAIRRHDYGVAAEYAAKSGPGRRKLCPLQSVRPELLGVLESRAGSAGAGAAVGGQASTRRSKGTARSLALDRDPRKPASLAPMFWNNWGAGDDQRGSRRSVRSGPEIPFDGGGRGQGSGRHGEAGQAVGV